MAPRRTREPVVPPTPMPRDAAGPDPVEMQRALIAARFGFDPARARVVAELAWGRR